MTNLERENAALSQENVKLAEQYDELKGIYEAVCADRDAERTNAEVWREKYEKLSGEMEQWQAECHADESTALARIEKLQEQLENAEEQRKSAESALQRMKQRADILENAVASAKANGEGAFRECESIRQHNVELQNKITRLLNREKQLQAALAEICIRAFCGGDKDE